MPDDSALAFGIMVMSPYTGEVVNWGFKLSNIISVDSF